MPVSEAPIGAFVALLVKVIVPDAVPLACGLNVQVKVALWPAASVTGRDNPLIENSGLVDDADDTVTPAPPAVSVPARF